jgi:O-antigen/teichoic acid export membrane protein
MANRKGEFSNPKIKQQSLRSLATQSFLWTAISTLGTTGLWFVINIVLARLLSPDAFGLVGLSAVFVNIANVINGLGLSAAIIQHEDLDDVQVSTAFWVNLGVGLLSTALLAGGATIIADFYGHPDLAPIMMVLSFSFFFSSLGSIQRALLIRSLDFKLLSVLDIVALFASAVVSIGLALKGGGAYSLAIQEVVRSLVRAILGWIFTPWNPAFVFDWQRFQPLFNFSSTVLVSDIINYVSSSMDRFLIGKLVGVSEVGYYNLSYNLVRLPQAKIAPLLNRISYPILARVQNESVRLQRGYLKTVQYISLLSFPGLLGLFTIAPEFIYVVYGPKWEPSIILLRLLCVAGMVYSFATTVGSFLYPCGRPDLVLKGNIYRIFLLGGCVLVGTRWGIVGVAAAVSVYTIIFLFPLYLWFLWQAGRLSPLAMLKALLPALSASIIMSLGVYGCKLFIFEPILSSPLAILIFTIPLGGALYLMALWLMYRELLVEALDLVASQLGNDVPPKK